MRDRVQPVQGCPILARSSTVGYCEAGGAGGWSTLQVDQSARRHLPRAQDHLVLWDRHEACYSTHATTPRPCTVTAGCLLGWFGTEGTLWPHFRPPARASRAPKARLNPPEYSVAPAKYPPECSPVPVRTLRTYFRPPAYLLELHELKVLGEHADLLRRHVLPHWREYSAALGMAGGRARGMKPGRARPASSAAHAARRACSAMHGLRCWACPGVPGPARGIADVAPPVLGRYARLPAVGGPCSEYACRSGPGRHKYDHRIQLLGPYHYVYAPIHLSIPGKSRWL